VHESINNVEGVNIVNKKVLEVVNVTKRFPGVIALDRVNFELRRGEIHALLGENGAGKSTLVKILYGIYAPDEGEIYVEGKRVTISSPKEALRYGLALVSQTPQLIDRLTVAENIILGFTKYGLMSSTRKIYRRIIETAENLGIKIDPNVEVWKLSYTQKQLVEILRALLLGAKVLMLDEATTFLPLREKKRFYDFMRKFASWGGSVILITHKIIEALDVSDRITVLRLGKVVGTVRREKVTIDDIRRMMFAERAKEITYERLPTSIPEKEVALEVKDLWVLGDHGAYAVKGIDLKVKAGEVVGIAGIAGNGQRELVQAIMGLRKVSKGKIFIYGSDVTNKSTMKVRELGVGYIPDIPMRYGIAPDNNIEENIAMLPIMAKGIIRWSKMRSTAQKLIEEFKIVTPSTKTPVKLLSGGNLMKVLVSRELMIARKLLVAYNPTRALDEATAIMVRKIIKNKALRDRVGVLVVSEDLDEIFQVSDTIAVINSGKIVGVFPGEKAVRDEVERLMVM